MKFHFNARNIAYLGVLTAIEIIFQVLGNFVSFGPIALNLSLLPITIAALWLGPWAGLFIGLVNGILVIFAPSTQALFMSINPVATVIVCLIKTSIAGFIGGLIYLPFKDKKHDTLGCILTSIIVPILNTGIFSIFALTAFRSLLESYITASMPNAYIVLILVFIGWNFIFELSTSLVLSPLIIKTMKIVKKRKREF